MQLCQWNTTSKGFYHILNLAVGLFFSYHYRAEDGPHLQYEEFKILTGGHDSIFIVFSVNISNLKNSCCGCDKRSLRAEETE